MAFWGNTFIFDDVACTEFGLMVYDFNSNSQDDVEFQAGNVIEDRILRRYDSFMYGLDQNQSLEYTLVFGANMYALDNNKSLDRYEVEAIASWLTGHQERKWLTIMQDDTESYRYKCVISNLKLITYGSMPWAFSCRVTCDSPFAYTFPEEFEYTISGSTTINFFNRSTYNGYFRPKVEITMSGGDVEIENISDKNRIFKFSDVPAGDTITIFLDNQNQIITSDIGLNLYPYFNMNFMRLVRGDNILKITGDCTIRFICEFPVTIGG